jgi:hypothetical protein
VDDDEYCPSLGPPCAFPPGVPTIMGVEDLDPDDHCIGPMFCTQPGAFGIGLDNPDPGELVYLCVAPGPACPAPTTTGQVITVYTSADPQGFDVYACADASSCSPLSTNSGAIFVRVPLDNDLVSILEIPCPSLAGPCPVNLNEANVAAVCAGACSVGGTSPAGGSVTLLGGTVVEEVCVRPCTTGIGVQVAGRFDPVVPPTGWVGPCF